MLIVLIVGRFSALSTHVCSVWFLKQTRSKASLVVAKRVSVDWRSMRVLDVSVGFWCGFLVSVEGLEGRCLFQALGWSLLRWWAWPVESFLLVHRRQSFVAAKEIVFNFLFDVIPLHVQVLVQLYYQALVDILDRHPRRTDIRERINSLLERV